MVIIMVITIFLLLPLWIKPKLQLSTLGTIIWLLVTTSAWADNKTPAFTVKLSAEQVWQRQQVIMTIEVHTQDSFARLESGVFEQDGLTIIPFPPVEEQRDEANSTRYTSTTPAPQTTLIKKWAIYPFISGSHSLQLPRIRYRPNRGRIITLDIPNPSLQVKALPLYIPPTMPIGEINLSNNWNKALTGNASNKNTSDKNTPVTKSIAKRWREHVITPNNLHQWTITVTGKGVARQNMPPISRQLISTTSYEVFPAQRTQETIKTEQGITQIVEYSIPIKATKSGKLTLPKIEVQYFDPTSGKLLVAQLNPPFLIALNKYLQWLTLLLILAITITLLIVMSQKIKKRLRQILKYRQALQSLKKASTYKQVRTALGDISQIKKWGENLSLSEFLYHWEQRPSARIRDGGNKLEAAIQQLQAYQFSNQFPQENSELTINLIAKTLLKAIKTG